MRREDFWKEFCDKYATWPIDELNKQANAAVGLQLVVKTPLSFAEPDMKVDVMWSEPKDKRWMVRYGEKDGQTAYVYWHEVVFPNFLTPGDWYELNLYYSPPPEGWYVFWFGNADTPHWCIDELGHTQIPEDEEGPTWYLNDHHESNPTHYMNPGIPEDWEPPKSLLSIPYPKPIQLRVRTREAYKRLEEMLNKERDITFIEDTE